jgi:hypothetical protein
MVKEEQVLVYKCTCFFCGHKWRAWELPLRCASCKRPGWNKDKPKVETPPPLVVEVEIPERELISIEDILNWRRED